MTSKEKRKKAGHWKMAVHTYYMSRCPEYRTLRFTEQMRLCEFLYKENTIRTLTQDELDMRYLYYMAIKHYMDKEDEHGKEELQSQTANWAVPFYSED